MSVKTIQISALLLLVISLKSKTCGKPKAPVSSKPIEFTLDSQTKDNSYNIIKCHVSVPFILESDNTYTIYSNDSNIKISKGVLSKKEFENIDSKGIIISSNPKDSFYRTVTKDDVAIYSFTLLYELVKEHKTIKIQVKNTKNEVVADKDIVLQPDVQQKSSSTRNSKSTKTEEHKISKEASNKSKKIENLKAKEEAEQAIKDRNQSIIKIAEDAIKITKEARSIMLNIKNKEGINEKIESRLRELEVIIEKADKAKDNIDKEAAEETKKEAENLREKVEIEAKKSEEINSKSEQIKAQTRLSELHSNDIHDKTNYNNINNLKKLQDYLKLKLKEAEEALQLAQTLKGEQSKLKKAEDELKNAKKPGQEKSALLNKKITAAKKAIKLSKEAVMPDN